ncbi:uncharacterized protein CTRU02_201214 [Colletotrichum truncatum]|uniref:Uncharacterized protein n=1 Tax=Colletotrichum truncatum TaxID=5467 RepID=A0ACC3ZGP9_COLTU
MKFSATIFLLSTVASALTIQQRAPSDAGAIVSPFLAPACQLTDIATEALCKFPNIALTPGQCQDVQHPCAIHPPTSFVAQLTPNNSKKCYVAVFPNFGCTGDEVDTGALEASRQSKCIEAPYFGKLLSGGLLSSSILPFGFKSAKLVCA